MRFTLTILATILTTFSNFVTARESRDQVNALNYDKTRCDGLKNVKGKWYERWERARGQYQWVETDINDYLFCFTMTENTARPDGKNAADL